MVDLIPSRRGRQASPDQLFFIRELRQADLESLATGTLAAQDTQRLATIRHSHHHLAQLIARGYDQETISLMTGYSPSYISNLKNDVLFAELIDYYTTQREMIFTDALERLKLLGLNTIDELQERLAQEPESWTKRELMELAELTLIKSASRGASQQASQSGPLVNIEVKFKGTGTASPGEAGPIIEGTIIDDQ